MHASSVITQAQWHEASDGRALPSTVRDGSSAGLLSGVYLEGEKSENTRLLYLRCFGEYAQRAGNVDALWEPAMLER